MAIHPGFGVFLSRLMRHRGMDLAWLSSASGIPETELRSVTSGMPPSVSHLDNLAPALGFHAADLYVMAEVPVPEVLTSRDPAAGSAITDIVQIMMALPSDQRAHVHQLIEQLPLELEERPSAPPFIYDQHEAGLGAMLANLLCGNRNLRSPTAAAKILALLTEGRVYLAASTISGIGRGRVPLTPDRVAGFATALGIAVGDLAAITGVEVPEPPRPDNPLAAETAGLLWDCRRLTTDQAEGVRAEARSMLVPVPDDVPGEDWNRVHHHHGRWWGAPRR
ncbi:hypothetical protein [Streptomyces soliscabiei]|uniref:hypothetical protein n=1 Tax=Streptomyces soliscabiei TaxID=588897 RepID=UPI0029A6FA25|nr:hypothetical protein [Streptomyces sp. NY05-11A]MDX2675925.1 hypothetical protein [Streptomyces sp. NY05-11A]